MQNSERYAGDVEPRAAYENLSHASRAVLVDVRTQVEWNFVGVPDLRAFDGEPLFVEWQSFPPAPPVNGFIGQLAKKMSEKGLDQTASIYFLCRSGVRSLAAANAMAQAGYVNCFNIAGGFEGPLNPEGHRGVQSGWKASGLPWIQS